MSNWIISSEDYNLEFYGVAPVTARGIFKGFPAFFHQRWDAWVLKIYSKGSDLESPAKIIPIWEFCGRVKNGIVVEDENEAKIYIETALKAWRNRNN